MTSEIQKKSSKSQRSSWIERSDKSQSYNDAADDYVLIKIREISPQHREILKRTFDKAYEESVKNGTAVYIKLLCEYPEYKNIWPQLRSVADSALISSDMMKNLAIIYMEALKKIVGSLDNETELMKQLHQIAKSHIKWKISKEHILNMLPGYITMMKQCSSNYTSEIEEAWKLLYEIIGDLLEYSKAQISNSI